MVVRGQGRRQGGHLGGQIFPPRMSRSGGDAHLARGVTVLRSFGVCVGAVVPLVTGCGRGDPPPAPPTTVTTPATATTTTSDPATPVLAGYRAFWGAYLQAADPMDPTNPALTATATGEELQQVKRTFTGHFQKGEVIRGELDLRPKVTGQTGSTATVTDCYGDSTHVYDSATGERKDPPETVRYQVTATMVTDGGVWKVSTMKKEGEGCNAA